MITLFLASVIVASPLVIEPATRDLGTIRSGVPITLTFQLTNNGSTTIQFGEPRPSCGCLHARIDRPTLPAGESTTVEWRLHTLTQAPGPNRWRLELPHRIGDQMMTQSIEVVGQLVRELSIEPASLTLPATFDRPISIRITDRRPQVLQLQEVQSTLPFVNARIISQQQVDVRISGEVPIGVHRGSISIRTNDPAYRDIAVPIEVQRAPKNRVMVQPSELVIRRVPGQSTHSGVIQLRSNGEESVRIDQASSPNAAISTSFGRDAGKVVAVRVRVRADMEGEAELRIELAEPSGEVITVPVRWR